MQRSIEPKPNALATYLWQRAYIQLEENEPELLDALRQCHEAGMGPSEVQGAAQQTLGFSGEAEAMAIGKAYLWLCHEEGQPAAPAQDQPIHAAAG